MMNPVGIIGAVNSLAAVKYVVFEKKYCTMEELHNALEANWVGYEELQKLCKEAPKYSNNIDFVDNIATDLFDFWSDSTKTFTGIYGEPPRQPGFHHSIRSGRDYYTSATPDGKKSSVRLFRTGLLLLLGTDTHGPTLLWPVQ